MKNQRVIIRWAMAMVMQCVSAICYAQMPQPSVAPAQPAPVATSQGDAIVNSATAVLNEIMSTPAQGIPRRS